LALCLPALSVTAGCGGSDGEVATNGTRSGAQTTAARPGPPCPAVLPGARARLLERAPDVVTCAYADARPRVRLRVTFDDAPQASFRFERTVVERSQAHLGGAPAELPQEVAGIGRGADWIGTQRVLLATDDRRLVTVTVDTPARAAAARAQAVAVARAALG
jgi:hypothetical protein